MTPLTRHQIAGMALSNGLLLVGPSTWAAALYDAQNGVTIVTRKRLTLAKPRIVQKLPILRGVLQLAESLSVVPHVRFSAPQARTAIDSPHAALLLVASGVASKAIRARMHGASTSKVLSGELLAGTISLASSIALLRGGELTQWHGAEHKVIAGYEQTIPAEEASRIHPRCGTQIAVPLLAATGVATVALSAAMPRHRGAARLLGQAIGFGVATEFIRAAQTESAGPITKFVKRLGFRLQRDFTTKEPNQIQLGAASLALETLLAREADTSNEKASAPATKTALG